MAFRIVLVSASGANDTTIILDSAFNLAKNLGSHLHVAHVRVDPRETIPVLGEGMSVGMIDDMTRIAEEECSSRQARARANYNECLIKYLTQETDIPSAAGNTVSWTETRGREDEVVAKLGRLADVIIVPRPSAEFAVGHTLALNAALFETGRPVLVVPPKGAREIGKKVVVSWNGSAQSARAVSSALPILQDADEVNVFIIESKRTTDETSIGVSEYMAYHGVSCLVHKFSGNGSSVGESLLKEADFVGADIIVMGAYTHSRMRQLILGGVTRHVLEHSDIPLLMAH
jgi:nucleotide-binding universal stress UspA family protein